MKTFISALVANVHVDQKYPIVRVLQKFSDPLLEKMVDCGIKICALAPGEKYRDHSLQISQLKSRIDSWSHPPAGLFVMAERTVYLRSLSTMTIAHELGHALDCALGNGLYWSETNYRVMQAFARAQQWITPYAATRIDEYFAESVRAYMNCNDRECSWPRATRAKLQVIDPIMHAIIKQLFTKDDL